MVGKFENKGPRGLEALIGHLLDRTNYLLST